LAALVEGEFDGGHKSRVNSGVLHLSGEMCSEAFFDEITSYARELPPQINEQSFFSRYFASRQAVLKMMPCTLNFQYAFATSLPVGMQKRIIDTVHVVHFVGMRKPWKLEDFRGANYGELAWHFYDRARRGRFRE
jgi:lipopolysaccharide biosynthesis glycosyltransferase